MVFGISSASYYPETIEFAVEHLAKHRIPVTELFLNTWSEMKPDFILDLKQILEKGPTRVISVHPFTSMMESMLFFTQYTRRIDDGLEFYKQYFEFCNQVGAKYLVFHGAYQQMGCEDLFYFEQFDRLNRAAKSMGVEVLQENVARCKSGSIEFICKMKKELGDSVHFVLDTKQCVRRGITAFEMLEAMGPQVSHIHISDFAPGEDCLPPGKGQFQFEKLFQILKKQEYQGAVLIEVYRQNYQLYQELIDAQKFLTGVFMVK